ncbi:MAG TPA: PEGA domain-containing protein, partial [Polyangiaceae bacterium]|nr:PEGA domain-containing protein [Polyangiaceae bacterium]
MRTLRDQVLCCFLAAAPFVYGTHALAADPEAEARERFERAVKLYEEGNYDAALVELRRASELRPSYKLFYNIGQVRVAMNDYAAALEAYRQYLAQGGDKLPAARREQVQRELKRLEQRVARLTVESDVAGAEVFVDDASVGTTPLAAPLVVNSGTRRVLVRHPDYLPQSRVVSLAGGVQERAVFSFDALSQKPAAAETPAGSAPARGAAPASSARRGAVPAADPGDSGKSGVWIGWAVTGALAAGAAVTGVMALSSNQSLADKRDARVDDKDELDSEAKRVRTLAIVTDALAVGALAAGGITLWLTLRSDGA